MSVSIDLGRQVYPLPGAKVARRDARRHNRLLNTLRIQVGDNELLLIIPDDTIACPGRAGMPDLMYVRGSGFFRPLLA